MTNPKLLLVEDDSTLGYILKEYLEMKNFRVTWAKNGLEGLEKFREEMDLPSLREEIRELKNKEIKLF